MAGTWIACITNAGKTLLSRWVGGGELTITGAAAGSGRVSEMAIMAQTALVSERQSMSIIKKTTTDAGVQIRLRITAAETAYMMQQIGLWAAIDSEQPVLLALCQAAEGVQGQPIPSREAAPDFAYTFTLTIPISNEAEFAVTIDMSAAATLTEIAEAVAEHDTDEDAHQDIREAISSAQETADNAVPRSQKGAAGGVATLGTDGKVPGAQVLPDGGLPGQLLQKSGTGDNAAAWGGWHSNPNLLDNWYFADPINQRKSTQYTTVGGTIDRWKLEKQESANASGSVTVNEDGILLQSTERGSVYFRQFLEAGYISSGSLVTLSVLYENKVGEWNIGQYGTINSLSSDNGLYSVTFAWVEDGNARKRSIQIFSLSSDSASIKIKAVKLELGAHQTLAHQDAEGNWVLNDPLPDKAAELAKCQRFLMPIGNIAHSGYTWNGPNFYFSVPNTMDTSRRNPVVLGADTDNLYVMWGVNNKAAFASLEVLHVRANEIRLIARSLSPYSANTPGVLVNDGGISMFLSTEL